MVRELKDMEYHHLICQSIPVNLVRASDFFHDYTLDNNYKPEIRRLVLHTPVNSEVTLADVLQVISVVTFS